MGYTVTAQVRSSELCSKMLSFLQANWKNWPELSEHPCGQYASGPLGFPDLSYNHMRRAIGFDFNASGGEREYIMAVVRWLAIRVGRKTLPLPFYIYDQNEAIPVLRVSPTDGRANLVDDWGVPLYDDQNLTGRGEWRTQAMLEMCEEPDALARIRAEIQRLDALWAEFKIPRSFEKIA